FQCGKWLFSALCIQYAFADRTNEGTPAECPRQSNTERAANRRRKSMTANRSGPPVVADLGAIVDWLDRNGRLIRVRSEVDPAHQLAAIAARFEGAPRAVLFEKVKGSDYPVFTG